MMQHKKILKNSLFLLSFALILGLILRAYSLPSTNFYPDEAIYYFIAKDYVENKISPWYTSIWQPPMFTWINSLSIMNFGLNEFSLRLPTVIFGTLTILLVYFLGKLWFNKKVGLLASAIIAVLPLHVVYSRLAFNDIMLTFFLILSIFLAECYFKKSWKPALYLSGIVFAITFLIKYNALVVWGLYWIFILVYAFIRLRNEFKTYFIDMLISNLVFAAATLALILSTAGIPMLIYAVNNFIFLAKLQSSAFTNPFYYHLLVLIELSPIIFILFFITIIYFLFAKKSREEWLILALIVIFFAIIIVQPRRIARHQLLVLPLITILLSRFIHIIMEKFHFNKRLKAALIAVLLVSSGLWGIYEVEKIKDFQIMGDIGSYIKNNYPDSVVHAYYSKQAAYYSNKVLGKTADSSHRISSLKIGDLFVYQVSKETRLENSPYEDTLPFLHKETTEYWRHYSPKFLKYVRDNGRILKQFKYNDGTYVILYQIVKTDSNVKDDDMVLPLQDNPNILYKFICTEWKKGGFLKSIMLKLFSKEQAEALNKKC